MRPTGDHSHAWLRRLHLGVYDRIVRQIPLSLLHYLKTPALKGLSMAFLHENLTLDLSPLLSFLSQPSVRLQRSLLASINTPIAEVIDCLKLTSSLTHLSLVLRPITDIDVLFVQPPNFSLGLNTLHTVCDPIFCTWIWRCSAGDLMRLGARNYSLFAIRAARVSYHRCS
ncbi:hypothetical protein C8R46DRAFT_1119139 [Mycena filopes]|nr:hypothetical protein C8R46DRAFT_1119139 [Mycena filopes]